MCQMMGRARNSSDLGLVLHRKKGFEALCVYWFNGVVGDDNGTIRAGSTFVGPLTSRRPDVRARCYGFGPKTSSTDMILMGPRFNARMPGSITFTSPTTTTAKRPGVMYFWATRCTSAAVTAWMRRT